MDNPRGLIDKYPDFFFKSAIGTPLLILNLSAIDSFIFIISINII